MRIGIIDFGTNTLRLDIFETDDEEYRIIYDNAIFSQIIENTVDNSLSQDGIEHVIETIEEHQQAAKHYRCDRIECFSTASLRYINNADDVLEQVEFRTGIKIRMISGDEEAGYDFMALSSDEKDKCSAGCDLGGGSLQLFTFDENGPTLSRSFPLGSSRMAKEYVSGTMPTAEEALQIMDRVKSELCEAGFKPCGGTLITMGGTAKTMNRLYKIIEEENGDTISTANLSSMLGVICSDPAECLELIEDIEPKRTKTLTPGIAVLLAAAEYMDCENILVSYAGVREGFLKSILNGGGEASANILDTILGLI